MTTENRNTLFLQHQRLIHKIIKINQGIITTLRLENDDVEQELAIGMMAAIDEYEQYRPVEPMRIEDYLSVLMQDAFRQIRKRHNPHGVTGLGSRQTKFYSLERIRDTAFYENERSLMAA